MKKSLTLFLGLLLYSTTPSAKTLMMECFNEVPGMFKDLAKELGLENQSLGIVKLETEATNESKELLNFRVEGNWFGECDEDFVICRKGDDSVVMTIQKGTNQNGVEILEDWKFVYDFKFLTFKNEGKIMENGEVKDMDVKGTCKRINL